MSASRVQQPYSPVDWRVYPPADLSPILAVALRGIVRYGYEATSVRTIASEVGVTVPTLYYHHGNKQGILSALLDHSMERVNAHVDAAVAEAGDDPAARLANIVEAIVLYMTQHSDLAFLDSERRSLTAENLEKYRQDRRRIDMQVRSAIADGCAAGIFGTEIPEAARRAILTMCQGVADWYSPEGPDKPEKIAADYAVLALATVEHRRAQGTSR